MEPRLRLLLPEPIQLLREVADGLVDKLQLLQASSKDDEDGAKRRALPASAGPWLPHYL